MTEPPRAKKGAKERAKPFVPAVKTSRAVLEQSEDPRLEAFAEYGQWASVENNMIPAYRAGTTEPIHTRFGLADSTRITSSRPNVQNLSTDAGIRECFVPRAGYCFVAVDHTGLENAALAQTIIRVLGTHQLADFLNGGGDLHCLTASAVLGCTYPEAMARHEAKDKHFKEIRNAVKPINFGRPGGAGWKTLKFIAKQGYGLDWTEQQTKGYIQAWERAVPEGRAYLQWVSRRKQDAQGRYEVGIPGLTITRRGLPYCSAANNGFQALGTVIEAEVGWGMLCERLSGRSVLSQCALVNFVHDEWIWEVPVGLQTEVAARLEWHMCESPAVRRTIPDIQLKTEAVAMARWSKKAERLILNGELAIWEEPATLGAA
jgi:DNA polymerase I-like protein with 3'-5' exonuclease and polymerase domains